MASKLQLRRVRASLGLTQKELAALAHVSEQAIVDIERNKVKPRMVTAYAIVNALNPLLEKANRELVTIDSFTWDVQGA